MKKQNENKNNVINFISKLTSFMNENVEKSLLSLISVNKKKKIFTLTNPGSNIVIG